MKLSFQALFFSIAYEQYYTKLLEICLGLTKTQQEDIQNFQSFQNLSVVLSSIFHEAFKT